MKLCVLFPGIGYTVDKPLLYFSQELALSRGFEVRHVEYHGLPQIKGLDDTDAVKLQAYNMAVKQAKECLADVNWDECDEVLFVGKSIGTIVAAALAEITPYKGEIKFVYFTPLSFTFKYAKPESGPVFTGTADPWVEHDEIIKKAAELNLPCYTYEDANHSLITGDVTRAIEILKEVFAIVESKM